ncbi:MAG TPA: RDD family protein [Aliarcobacter cryaerophilus]|nr:RDD family protein [Aliarcobacter cryaerophilus]
MAKWRDVKQNRIQEEKIIEPIKKSSKNDLASLPSRLKAFLTDTFLITTPIFYIVIYLIMGSGEEFSQNRTVGWGIIFFVHIGVISIFWLKNGQTPGLRAYDIKLVDNLSKQKISIIQVFVRYITTLFAVVSIFLLFIPFFNKDKKTFQDILSNTIIINDK